MGQPSATYTPTLNEFTATLVEKIGKQLWSSKSWTNPLAQFKKGFIEDASEIEEIYVARIQGGVQDPDGGGTLDRVKPTVKSKYHKQNYGKCYTATISDKQARRAFANKDGIRKLADEILSQLQTGYHYDEFVAMKANFEDFMGLIPVGAKKTITEVTDNASAKAFVKQLKKDIAKMAFRNKDYCAEETSSKNDELVLITTPDMLAEIDVELLANAFNISKAEIPMRVVTIDSFPTDTNARALLCDKGAIQVYGTLYNMETQRNAKGMFTNYHLNVEMIISTSSLYNGCLYSVSGA